MTIKTRTNTKRQRKDSASSQEIHIVSPHTDQELWKWSLTPDAIAPCFIRDALYMKENPGKGMEPDFFWLGRVPCRNVQLVAIVVGVQIHEKRIIYSVDDGTAVVDCSHRCVPAQKQPSKGSDIAPPLAGLVPVADVGALVRVVGKVIRWHESRQITVDRIEPCINLNDEPHHWRKVLALHKSNYSLLEPFTIPASWHSPRKEQVTETLPIQNVPPTPSSAGSRTPLSSNMPSPAKSSTNHHAPTKLRHPSRLHSRDLTANAFRIYLKHFMDNAPTIQENPPCAQLELDSIDSALRHLPSTPTKRSRHARSDESTPRSYPICMYKSPDLTPRPRARPPLAKFSIAGNITHRPVINETPSKFPRDDRSPRIETLQGFTMSYLRRVPELSEMARRVVKAEAKRRARAEGQKSSEPKAKSSLPEMESIGRKMKRLFRWAIIKLYEEGSIVLWDGPARTFSSGDLLNASGLWKSGSSTVGANSSVFSSLSVPESDIGGDEELSDPQEGEEAYIPLTPAYLARYVEEAIGTLTARAPQSRSGSPRPGPTKEEIVSFLQRVDGRWARVGEWAVDDAIELLRREERVWSIGRGRWELCL